MRIHQGTAGIAGIDGRVGLDSLVNRHAIRLPHGTNRTHNSCGEGPAQPKRVTDRIDLLSDLEIARVAQHRRGQIGSLNLNDGQIVRTVCTHHFRAILLAIVEGDLDALRVGNNVIVGQDVAFLVDNEPRPLAFLRNQPVKEIKSHGSRGDINYRGDVLAIDANVVLFFAIERFVARSLGNLDLVGTPKPLNSLEPVWPVSREVKEGSRQHHSN